MTTQNRGKELSFWLSSFKIIYLKVRKKWSMDFMHLEK
jgi:hypothetical protein